LAAFDTALLTETRRAAGQLSADVTTTAAEWMFTRHRG